jgi:hypothetical protein
MSDSYDNIICTDYDEGCASIKDPYNCLLGGEYCGECPMLNSLVILDDPLLRQLEKSIASFIGQHRTVAVI